MKIVWMPRKKPKIDSCNDIDLPKTDNNGGGGLDQNSSHPKLPITSHKLTSQNYLQWYKSILIFIGGKGKDDYLTLSNLPQKMLDTVDGKRRIIL
ncbi:hypothetical protein Ddye_004891 [Dipteronia dyeriana]|uniref:Retrotransposon Copia-like N-terminal domain-containing protein n=1 Tax=Dipteronia dyeriana TaxID=168575 RepID=A0AAD9XG21_9ROSI|nr:hypothetical protein Ddye_004891 [Dipteronia dyeriana]